jgi:hypothetical protein
VRCEYESDAGEPERERERERETEQKSPTRLAVTVHTHTHTHTHTPKGRPLYTQLAALYCGVSFSVTDVMGPHAPKHTGRTDTGTHTR